MERRIGSDLIEQDIGSHKNRIRQESCSNVFAHLLGFLFVLDHSLEPRDGRRTVEQPKEFGVRRHMTLEKDTRLRSAATTSEIDRRL